MQQREPASARAALALGLSGCLFAVACTGVVGDISSSGPGSDEPSTPGADGGAVPGDVDPGVVKIECGSGEEPGRRLLRLLTRGEYVRSVSDLLGVSPPAVDSLPIEPEIHGFRNNADAAAVTARHIDLYLAAATDLAGRAIAERRDALVPCTTEDEICARQFVERMGRRVFRRPLDAEEIATYTGLFASELTGGRFATGLELALQAFLISPHFLYRSELGTDVGDVRPLTPYEIASALSFGLLGTTPSDDLLDEAASGAFDTPEGVEAEARALLADPRAVERILEFASQWLGTSKLTYANKDPEIYPAFSDEVRRSMLEEERRFLDHVLFESTGTYRELLLADYAFLNGTLASFYGVSGGGGSEYAKVPVDGTRGGILRLGSVLASHAHFNESSPIERGVFVRKRILCHALQPPPQNLDTTPPPFDPTLTTRERFRVHTQEKACQACHVFIDGIGFGFEDYDGVGAHRTLDNGRPIDVTGELFGLESLSDGAELKFQGAAELSEALAETEAAPACFATMWFRFARGTGVRTEDLCSLQSLQQRALPADGDLKDAIIHALVQPSFLTRR